MLLCCLQEELYGKLLNFVCISMVDNVYPKHKRDLNLRIFVDLIMALGHNNGDKRSHVPPTNVGSKFI